MVKSDTNVRPCRTWRGRSSSGSTSTGTIPTPPRQRKSSWHSAPKWRWFRWDHFLVILQTSRSGDKEINGEYRALELRLTVKVDVCCWEHWKAVFSFALEVSGTCFSSCVLCTYAAALNIVVSSHYCKNTLLMTALDLHYFIGQLWKT